ncbi:MAG: isoprenylcysteine carboxylmethyltransferase family protein [bacterium]|nr:isoprenylcysteine carboxylmethyltransferase family protein [bacterium]
MDLQDRLCREGDTLFRLRSYVPLLLLALMILALWLAPGPRPLPAAWIWACLAVSLVGQLIRADVVGHTPDGTSGRNTSVQVAKRLNTVGWYSVVRHPLYVGNGLMWLGLALLPANWWLALLMMGGFGLIYERIMLCEERFIQGQYGEEFRRWAEETPAFLPRFSRWRPWDLAFSWRNVARREFSGFFALIGLFVLLLVLREVFAGRPVELSRGQNLALLAGLAAYATLFVLRRWTRLLHEEPR